MNDNEEHLSHCESADIKSEERLIDEQLVSSSSIVDTRQPEQVVHNQSDSPLANNKSNTISSSPSASSDSGHCSRASPDITSLTTTPNGALQSMASASGESPTDYHQSWAMCATDAVKVDLTSQTSHALSESDSNIYSTSADHLNSPYPELSPTHQTYSSNPFYESMQATGLYQSPYSASSGAAVAFAANYYQQNSPYSGIIPQSYNGSRSISSQCKTSSSGLAAPYLNPSAFSSSFTNSNSQTQNAYNCYGQYSSFSNSGSNSQSFGNCQQSGLDYSSYSGFSHATGYSPYYTSSYGSYIPNSSSSNVNNGSPPSGLSSSSNNSSSATYQLTQLPQQSDANLSHYHIDDCPSPHIKSEAHLNSNTGPKKGSTKSGRGRGRRQPNPSPDPDNNLERVFIWDLDETIILFLSFLNGARGGRPLEESPHQTSYDLANQLELIINRFAETHLFYEDLEEVDQNHVDDTATDDSGQDLSNYNFQADGFHTPGSCTLGLGLTSPVRGGAEYLKKMAFRYRRIKEIYNQYRDNVGGLLSTQDRENLFKIQRKWDVITDNWTLLALKCLQLINSRAKCVNVLVTSLPLVPTLAKVMIFGLASNFNIENIYSAAKTGKEDIFARIVNKFGKKCTYVVIGDGREEEAAAIKHGLPFWPVHGITDLVALQHALDLGHL